MPKTGAAKALTKASSLITFAALAAFGLALGLAKNRVGDEEVWQQAIGVAVAAGIVAFIAPRRSWGALSVGVVASAGFAALVGSSSGLDAGVGWHCLVIELGGAAAPLGVSYLLARSNSIARTPGAFAAAAVAGSLAAQAALNLTCPVHSAQAHLVVFHVGGVLLSALFGAALGRGLTRAARAARVVRG